jgi:DNA replication protein DnaC
MVLALNVRNQGKPMADVTINCSRPISTVAAADDGGEFEKLADAAATNQTFVQFAPVDRLELATARRAVATRSRMRSSPCSDFDTYDFSIMPGLSKPKILELARCEWIEQKFNCCLIGGQGTGKNPGVALGQAARQPVCGGVLAAELVSRLEKAQKQYTLTGLDQLSGRVVDLR